MFSWFFAFAQGFLAESTVRNLLLVVAPAQALCLFINCYSIIPVLHSYILMSIVPLVKVTSGDFRCLQTAELPVPNLEIKMNERSVK